jgi:hypothetical protein
MGAGGRGSGVNELSSRGVPALEGGALVWAKAGAIEQAVAIKTTITRLFGMAASGSCQG